MTTGRHDADPRQGIDGLEQQDQCLFVKWSDGRERTLQAIWLRDNCRCPECSHGETGQRLVSTDSIPRGITLLSSRVAPDGSLEIDWTDGHQSVYPAAWLNSFAHRDAVLFQKAESLWDAHTLDILPRAGYAEVTSDESHLASWLVKIEEYGFALLQGVATDSEQVLQVVALFGFVRETNYGRYFDVRTVVNPNNLAYTGLALGPHTDNPYRDPTPTLQLLHCLSSSTSGGENTLVDGFRVAEELRRLRPDWFELLSTNLIQFQFRDAQTELFAEFPVITLNLRGEVAAIHFNTRSTLPFRLSEDLLEAYYEAYRGFSAMLRSREFEICFALSPGDLVLMNNLRVLHGRTAFSAGGDRHMQGCYADIDGLRSKLGVLRRAAEGTSEQKSSGADAG